jgi:hypothetical protein
MTVRAISDVRLPQAECTVAFAAFIVLRALEAAVARGWLTELPTVAVSIVPWAEAIRVQQALPQEMQGSPLTDTAGLATNAVFAGAVLAMHPARLPDSVILLADRVLNWAPVRIGSLCIHEATHFCAPHLTADDHTFHTEAFQEAERLLCTDVGYGITPLNTPDVYASYAAAETVFREYEQLRSSGRAFH